MAVVSQATYDAMKNIVDQKALWHNAKSTGQNPDPYKEAARQYYDQLVNSNQKSIADQLNASNYEQAKKLLDSYVVEPVKAQNTGNTGGVKVQAPTVAEQAGELLPLYQSYVQPTPQQTAFQQQQQQNLQNLFNSYVNNQAQNQQKNNEIFTGLKAEADEAKKNYQDLYNRLFNTNYLDSDVSKTILEGYGIKGDAASAAESAAGAAGNSGNIDSYSAANAKRQQLAFKNAGQQAALAAWDTQIARALETLKSMGVDVSGYYQQMQGNVDSDADFIKNLLASYNAGTSDLGAQYVQGQQDNAQYLAGLLGSLIDADTSRYQTDAEVGMNERDNQTEISLAEIEKGIREYEADLNTKIRQYEADKTAESAKEVQDIVARYQKYISDNNLAETKYTADIDRKIAELNNDATYNRLVYQTENSMAGGDDLFGLGLDGLLGANDTVVTEDGYSNKNARGILSAYYNQGVVDGRGTEEERLNSFIQAANAAITRGTITQGDLERFVGEIEAGTVGRRK